MAKPTIHDVARLAGVSIKTVSRVTNGDGYVAADTAHRVRQAIRELGYLANPNARSLRTGRDDAVGLIVESIGDPFFASVTEAVEEAAREAGLFLLVASAGQTPDQERAAVRGLLSRSVRGLIIVPCHLAYGSEPILRPETVPVVFADRPPADLDADVVMIDNAATGRSAAEHLIAAGHRRIAFVGPEVGRYPISARLAGYRQALEEHGLSYDPALVISRHRPTAGGDLLLGRPLANPDPASAVLCSNLLASLAVARELHRTRRTDVAMVGIDDFPVAEALDPPITVATQSPELMGRQAFELLLGRIAGETSPPRRIVLPTTFIVRGSGEIRYRPAPAPPPAGPGTGPAPFPAGLGAGPATTGGEP
jgi:LacI family transcriptional regulator